MIPLPPRLPRRHWTEDEGPANGAALLFIAVVLFLLACFLLLTSCGTLTSYEVGAQAGRSTTELFRDGSNAWQVSTKFHFDVGGRK